jgi:hypothetical protein
MSEPSLNELMARMFTLPTKGGPAVGTIRRAAFTPELRGIDEKNRTIDFVASTEAVDRYHDILRVRGFQTENYLKNPVFLWAHKSSEPPIGKTIKLWTESLPAPALIQRVQFCDKATYDFADMIFNLYKSKFLNAVSVGFIPLSAPTPILDADGRSTGGYEFTSMELLELSAVPLPANPECVSRAIDSGIITTDDVAKVFTAPQSEGLASAGDYIGIAYNLGKLAHAAERLEAVVRDAAPVLTVGDLKRIMGRREREAVASVEDLERLFRLE